MNSYSTAAAESINDVIVIGCGPTGAALANLLGRCGLSVRVLDRNFGVLDIPRAVHIDGESMRVLQSMGLASGCMPIMQPGGSMHWVNAAGEALLVRNSSQGLGPHGWHSDYYFHQPQLEAVLREGMARFPNVHLHEGLEVQQLREHDGMVEVSATDAEGVERILRARYVVGCDGARSRVRERVGNDFEDLGECQTWLVVDGILHRPLDLPEHSVQHCDPARPATSIYVQPLRRRWELMLLPGENPREMTELAIVWPLLRRWVKPSQAVLERAATYTFQSLVACRWQQNRVFLAGDAAHLTPPFLGQGLCAGLRDAANLAWKLDWAVRNPAGGAAVLATYDTERIPHVREFIALAVEVGKVIQVTDPVQAAERDARLLRQGMSFSFPSPTLGPGLHRAGVERPAVGKIAPQFEMADGRWSDELVDDGWALLVDGTQAPLLDAAVEARLIQMRVTVLPASGRHAAVWLREQGAATAILRPDHYVFDLCVTRAELVASLDALEKWLAPEKLSHQLKPSS